MKRYLVLILTAAAWGQTPPAPAKPEAPAAAPAKPQQRMGATAMRNENVAVYLIDTNAAKEAAIRAGSQVTLVTEATVESNHFAADQGRGSDRKSVV